MAKQTNNAGASLGFEAQLWSAADKLRGNMEPSDYKHVALGLIFLKYISDAFEAKQTKLLAEDLADPEEYLAKMNLAVRGIDADIRWNNEGSFRKDELPDLKADYMPASPPFNVSDWGGDRLQEDARRTFGIPPAANANYAWHQHIHHRLAPKGTADVVLANGSMSGEVRRYATENAVEAVA